MDFSAPAPQLAAVDDSVVEHFRTEGWALVDALDVAALADLRAWVDDISSWPVEGDGWLHHLEMTGDGPKLCRSENLIPFHAGLRALLTEGRVPQTAGALLGETAALYKEKINYKLPGGAGYSPHQDAPAYPFVASHVSAMLAIDDASSENGGLEVVPRMHAEVLPMDDTGCIRPDVVATMEWQAVDVAAGQTLWFHSRTPHRSGPNLSATPRRALYPTYNAVAEGDLRTDYYREKLAEFAGNDEPGDRVRVSLIGDFQGRPVT